MINNKKTILLVSTVDSLLIEYLKEMNYIYINLDKLPKEYPSFQVELGNQIFLLTRKHKINPKNLTFILDQNANNNVNKFSREYNINVLYMRYSFAHPADKVVINDFAGLNEEIKKIKIEKYVKKIKVREIVNTTDNSATLAKVKQNIFNIEEIETDLTDVIVPPAGKTWNIAAYSMHREHVYNFLFELYSLGFIMIGHEDQISRFVRLADSKNVLPTLTRNEFKKYKSVYYTVEGETVTPKKIVFIFVYVSAHQFNGALEIRNYAKPYGTLINHIDNETMLIRIADFGGVVGSFYMNNIINENIENDISDFIESMLIAKNVKRENAKTYGTSKGGLGALMYGFRNNLEIIAVDPASFSDSHEKNYYEKAGLNSYQSHLFFHGYYKTSIQQKILEFTKLNSNPRGTIITFKKSHYYQQLIDSPLSKFENLNIVSIDSRGITDHQNFGLKTIDIQADLLLDKYKVIPNEKIVAKKPATNIIISFMQISDEFTNNGFNNPLFDINVEKGGKIKLFSEYMNQFKLYFNTSKFYLLFEKDYVVTEQLLEVLEELKIENYDVLEVSKATINTRISDFIKEKSIQINKFVFTNFGHVFAEKIVAKTETMMVDESNNFIAIFDETTNLKKLFSQIDFYNIDKLTHADYEKKVINSVVNLNEYDQLVQTFPVVKEQVNEIINCINELIYNMQFEQAEAEFKKYLTIDQILVEYIIYLDRTAQIDILEVALKQYKIKELLIKIPDITHNVRLLELIVMQNNIPERNKLNKLLNGYSFKKAEDQKFFELIKNNPVEAKKYFHQNVTLYASDKIKDKDKEQLMSYFIQTLIRVRELKHEDVFQLIKEFIPTVYSTTSKYWPVNGKYLFAKIYDYMDYYDPKYFTIRHHEGDGSVDQKKYYNHIQPLIGMLTTQDSDEFMPGAKRYFEKIANKTEIVFPQNSTPPIRLATKSSELIASPKTAVCVSGMIRNNYQFFLEGLKQDVVDPLNADVYIFTWDKIETYSGIGRILPFPWMNWASRHFQKVAAILPDGIKTIAEFKETLPKTFSKLAEPMYEYVDKEEIRKIFPDAKITTVSEKEFDKKFDKPEFNRRGNLNQAKMFYGMYKAFEMAEKAGKYDFYYKSRFDVKPNYKYSYEFISQLGDREFGTSYNSGFGPNDQYFYARYNEMKDLTNIWNFAEEYGDLSKFKLEGRDAKFDSHKLFIIWMLYFRVIIAQQHMPYHVFSSYTHFDKLKLPNIENELKQDLENVSAEKAKEFLEFFKKMYEIYT